MKIKFVKEVQRNPSIILAPAPFEALSTYNHTSSRPRAGGRLLRSRAIPPRDLVGSYRREMDEKGAGKGSHHSWSRRISWLADVPAPVAAGAPGRRGRQPGPAGGGWRGGVPP